MAVVCSLVKVCRLRAGAGAAGMLADVQDDQAGLRSVEVGMDAAAERVVTRASDRPMELAKHLAAVVQELMLGTILRLSLRRDAVAEGRA